MRTGSLVSAPGLPSAASGVPRSWGAVADAVGHCLLVFAFVPALTALPRWLYSEAMNPLNFHEPLVLAFVPVRGIMVLLDAFSAGVAPGVLAGVVDGVLVSAWLLSDHGVSTKRQLILVGAICGALAASLVVLVAVARAVSAGARLALPAGAVAFAIGSGVVCGMIAVPTAVRFLTSRSGVDPAQVDASCRRG
jgi:hypothetical protein